MPLKKILNASRHYEHRPVRGETVKTFRWDQQAHVIRRITFSWAQNGSGARQSTDHPKKIGATKFPEIGVGNNTARAIRHYGCCTLYIYVLLQESEKLPRMILQQSQRAMTIDILTQSPPSFVRFPFTQFPSGAWWNIPRHLLY